MPASLERDPGRVAASRYDLAVVGGGIYGAALALEASRRGLAALLVERDDFGGATSWASLRIVHGGLRYLQGLDLPRFRESVAERRRWLAEFPDLVRPLPCLMPLYGEGLRRPAVMRAALAANDLLSRRRNRGVRADLALPGGRLLSAAETAALFPGVARDGLRGGALWHDAVAADTHRLLVEMLLWAARCGARALNYAAAEELLREGSSLRGLRLRDRATGEALEVAAPVVVNCAGPWCRELARAWDRDRPELFRPLLGFNLLLDREPPAEPALAVSPRGGGRSHFLLPWKGRLLAGTAYTEDGAAGEAGPGEAKIAEYLAELGRAVPGLAPRRDEVLRVLWGRLPAQSGKPGEPASRPVLHDHGRAGGPRGLWSVSGVKLTTARAVAERTLARIYGRRLPPPGGEDRPLPDPPPPAAAFARLLSQDPAAAAAEVARRARREAVVDAGDLLLRRTDWWTEPRLAPGIEASVRAFLAGQPPAEEPAPLRAGAGGGAG